MPERSGHLRLEDQRRADVTLPNPSKSRFKFLCQLNSGAVDDAGLHKIHDSQKQNGFVWCILTGYMRGVKG